MQFLFYLQNIRYPTHINPIAKQTQIQSFEMHCPIKIPNPAKNIAKPIIFFIIKKGTYITNNICSI